MIQALLFGPLYSHVPAYSKCLCGLSLLSMYIYKFAPTLSREIIRHFLHFFFEHPFWSCVAFVLIFCLCIYKHVCGSPSAFYPAPYVAHLFAYFWHAHCGTSIPSPISHSAVPTDMYCSQVSPQCRVQIRPRSRGPLMLRSGARNQGLPVPTERG